MTKNTSYNCNGAMTAIGHAHTKLGTTAPHTDEPWSEAMLFGLSGGVGQGYILWEFKKDSSAPLVLGFVHRWNYPAERLEHAGTRSGLNVTTTNTGSATKAEALLSEQLAKGIPSAVLTDWLHCPYAWYLTIDDEADGIFTARDTGKSPLAIPAEMLSAARAEVPSYKNALIGFSKGKRVSKTALKGNIKAAITDAVAYQSTSSDSFSLKALRKWSRALTDKEMAKSWPTVLGDGRNLL
ncbi:MAG: BtrH N-terminal domain-containing protein, partial [Alphaproteobacteria bacterium]